MLRRTLTVLAVSIALSGCPGCFNPVTPDGGAGGGTGGGIAFGGGGGATGGGTGGGSGGDALAGCLAFVTDYCDFFVRCTPTDRAECTATFTAFCQNLAAGVTRGYQRYDAAELQRCRTALQGAANCALTSLTCSPFGALVTDGGACVTTSDCADDDTTCGAAAGCPTRCDPAGQLGMPCTYSCATGLRCNQTTFTCDQLIPAGQACDPSFFGPQCAVDSTCNSTSGVCTSLPGLNQPCPSFQCATGLACKPADASFACQPRGGVGATCSSFTYDCLETLACIGGTCQTPLAMGQSCTNYRECQSGLSCSLGVCSAAKAEGEPCSGTSAAGFDECRNGLCDQVLRRCVAYSASPPAAGQPCGSRGCAEGVQCRGIQSLPDGGYSPGTCGTGTVGDNCTRAYASVEQCITNARCELADGGLSSTGNGTCRPVSAGARCRNSSDCLTAEYCVSATGLCAPRANEGQSCATAQCLQGQRCATSGTARTCVRPGALGQACASTPDTSAQCAEGDCVNSVCVLTGFPGMACNSGNCYFGRCDADAGTAGLCRRPSASGPCTADAQCESQRCRAGQCQAVCL